MKKRFAFILALSLSASLLLAGCGDSESSKEETGSLGQLGNSQNGTVDINTEISVSDDEIDFEITVPDDDIDFEVTVPDDDDGYGDEVPDYSTLEEYFCIPEVISVYQEEIDSTLDQYSDYYSNIIISVEGNDVTYAYFYTEEQSAYFDDLYTYLSNTDFVSYCNQGKDYLEYDSGIEPSSFTYEYYTADGTYIYGWTE